MTDANQPLPPQNIKLCACGKANPSWWEHDARGIPLARVCDECKTITLSKYRSDVLTDPNYWHDEPIDED